MAKRKWKKKAWSVRAGEEPTMERENHLGGLVQEVAEHDGSGKVLMLRHRAKYECMLDAYFIKGLIDKAHHEAGMRYRMAWLRVVEKIKIDDRSSSGRLMSIEEWLCSVSQNERYLKEANATLTERQKAMIMRVCVDDKRAGGTDALETFRRGLDRLAQLWGMSC